MKIIKLGLKNIRSYKDNYIEFPEGSILLSGDIGSGKTTILLAIEFALFGFQPGQKGSSLLSNGQESGEVSLELEIDGQEIVIKRFLKRGSKSVAQESASISINGYEQEMSATELKTRILDLINYPVEFLKKTNLLYRYTLYSPQEEMKQIILENPDERLNILRHIFGIDKYKIINENLLIVCFRLREEARMLQAEIKGTEELRSKKRQAEEHFVFLDGEIKNKSHDFEKKILSRKSIESESKNLAVQIEEKKRFEKEIEKANVLLKSKKQQASEISMQISEIERKFFDAPKSFSKEEFDRLLQHTEGKRNELDSISRQNAEMIGRLASLNVKKNDFSDRKARIFDIHVCPTCLQDVPERHKHNILSETESQMSSLEGDAKSLLAEMEKSGKAISLLKKEIASLEEGKSNMMLLKARVENAEASKARTADLSKSRDSLLRDIEFLENHITLLKKSVLEFSRFDSLFRANETELGKALSDERKSEIELAELRKEKELLKKSMTEMEREIEKKSDMQKRAHLIEEIEAWLSGDFAGLISNTERNILLKLREEFSKLFNKWFSMLTQDSFYVQLDENFTPIITQGDYELDYSFLSGGERTAVALAYRLALNQLLNSMFTKLKTRDIIILDEPTDGFSEQQLDKVRDILQEINVKQLILVSHEQKIESFVDNIIRIHKEAGHSTRG